MSAELWRSKLGALETCEWDELFELPNLGRKSIADTQAAILRALSRDEMEAQGVPAGVPRAVSS